MSVPDNTIEVGTVRLFVRPIVRSDPVGTVITTGDQPVAVGFNFAQVAPVAVPQVYPHIGTVAPSGVTRLAGPAVRLTWPTAKPAPKRRTLAASTAIFRLDLSKLSRIAALLVVAVSENWIELVGFIDQEFP